ncbi:MerR family transcriptional regulator [Pseudomonas tohonis]|uniref:MerR family transcriptional regulator n=1 Tax=Pseudomonas tohonis TaxID=2725477 RepID=UPI001F20C1A3|nr:MerR family transcriptional regulator [Pseudomonas tohonis]GJN48225.1 MerR family transcriptional regulator [Pseudomonas tohonis]
MDEHDDTPLDGDFQEALARGLLPIRDVSRLTGVNPVTLRAWERRYGLVLPQRTAKGHRLYAPEHVARIRAVLTWLDRGVPVGQVKGLLRGGQHAALAPSSLWDEQRHQLLESIAALAERRLDERFNAALSIYPPLTLCLQLLLPLLEALEERWRDAYGARLERVFFNAWLRSKLGARIYHNNRQHGGAPLLLLNPCEQPMAPGLWLSAWLASNAGCAVEVLEWPIPPAELPLAIARIEPRALLLYAEQALNGTSLARLLADPGCPLVLAGPAVHIHQRELEELASQGIRPHLADDPVAALQTLTSLGLLARHEDLPCAN